MGCAANPPTMASENTSEENTSLLLSLYTSLVGKFSYSRSQ